MSEDLKFGDRLSSRQVIDLINSYRSVGDDKVFAMPTGETFNLARYRPPGPIGAAYIRSLGPIDIIMGPGGSGKTVASVFKAVRFAVNAMPVCRDGIIRAKATVVRDNYRALYRSTLQTWFDWFPTALYPDFSGGQDRPGRHMLHIRTMRGAQEYRVDLQVDFFAIADLNYELLFKSYETSYAWATEADGVPAPAIPFFFSRTGRYPSLRDLPDGTVRPRAMGVDMNPPAPNHPLLKAAQRGSFRDDFDPAKHQRTVNFFVQPSGLSDQAENRAGKSRSDYQLEYDSLPRDEARRMVEGKPGRVKDGLPVYDEEFDFDLHVSKVPLEIIKTLPVHLGLDQGGLQPAGLFFQEAPDGQIRMLAELAPTYGTGLERFIEQLAPILHGPFRDMALGILACDPAGFYGADKAAGNLSWAESLGKFLGRHVVPAPTNEPAMRREALSIPMRHNIRTAVPGLIIDPGCSKFIEGLSTGYKYAKHHDGSFSPTPVKNEWSNVVEAGQYGVLTLRGVAGLMDKIARAGRPANVEALRPRAVVQNGQFDVWNT